MGSGSLAQAPYGGGNGNGNNGIGPSDGLPNATVGIMESLGNLNAAVTERDGAVLRRENGIRQLENSLNTLVGAEEMRIAELGRYNKYSREGLPTIDLAVSDEVVVRTRGEKVVTQQAVIDSTDNGFPKIATRQQDRAVYETKDGKTAYGEPEKPTLVEGISKDLATRLYDNGMREHHGRLAVDSLCTAAEQNIAKKIASLRAQATKADNPKQTKTI